MDSNPDALRPMPANTVDPALLLRSVIATATISLFFSTVFVSARVVSKLFIWRGHHLEDWLSYLAYVGLVAYTGIFGYIETFQLNLVRSDITAEQQMHIEYYLNLLFCIYAITMLAAKLSVLYQVKRIFTTQARDAVYWVVVVSIGTNVAIYVGLFFCYLLQCWPREVIWDPTIPGVCIDGRLANLAAGILNVISDLEALVVPMWAIWHLRVPLRRKLAAYVVFSAGSIATIIGAVGVYLRLVVLRKDFTSMLVIAEVSIVIVVGCASSLPGIYRRIRNRGRSGEGQASNSWPSPYYKSNEMRYGAARSGRKNGSFRQSFSKYVTYSAAADVTIVAGDEEDIELSSHAQDVPGVHSPDRAHQGRGIYKTTVLTQETTYHKKSLSSASTITDPV